MKVEITDRDLWLAKVEEALDVIEADRATRDRAYEADWRATRNRWAGNPLGRLLGFRPVSDDDKPPPDPRFDGDYPCHRHLFHWNRLVRIQKALLSTGTGAIYLDASDLLDID